MIIKQCNQCTENIDWASRSNVYFVITGALNQMTQENNKHLVTAPEGNS